MKEKRFKEIVSEGIADLFYIWWQELKAVVKDQGVLIFFILVPLGYPLLYTFIYTNETVRETILAGANAITYTPPSAQDLFKTIMAAYRE